MRDKWKEEFMVYKLRWEGWKEDKKQLKRLNDQVQVLKEKKEKLYVLA